MAVDFTIKQGDTGPALQVTCMNAVTNLPVDVTGATVKFNMSNGKTLQVDHKAATIVNSAGGIVQYSWAAADTATSGTCKGEFEVTFANGTIVTFPNNSLGLTIKIQQQVA